MNTSEGHLGGYIRASRRPAPSGLRIEHGDPRTWSPELWRWARERLEVASVLDVGCGEGHCAGFLRDLGCEVLGIDGSRKARRDSVIPDAHIVHDFADGPYHPVRQFDLVWSCEFVEHVEERYVPNFLATFRAARRYIMMTHAVPGQPGWHHVNCRPAAYWAAKLYESGFLFHEKLTEESRLVCDTAQRYSTTGLVFVRC